MGVDELIAIRKLKMQRDMLYNVLKKINYQLLMGGGDKMPTLEALLHTIEADKAYPPEVVE